MSFVRVTCSCGWALANEQAGVKKPHARADHVNLDSTSLSVACNCTKLEKATSIYFIFIFLLQALWVESTCTSSTRTALLPCDSCSPADSLLRLNGATCT
jgi:hypothetical protein